MNYKSLRRALIILAAVFWIFTVGIYWIANEQFRYKAVQSPDVPMNFAVGELTDENQVRQKITTPAGFLESISILAGDYGRSNTGKLSVSLKDSSENTVARMEIDVSTVNNGVYTTYFFDEWVSAKRGEPLTLCLETRGCQPGNAITIYAGVADPSASPEGFSFGETQSEGTLCVRLNGYDPIRFYQLYWVIVLLVFAALAICCGVWYRGAKQGKKNPLVILFRVYDQYTFLFKQLVMRDFKTKYKRSSLGMAWSFINPLLTMSVQYVVFSTLFKTDIPNYPVYLLTGIVFFSFFNEAISMGMTSITGNAALIKKVYMPKYVYPVSKVISSCINFVFALAPLFLVMLITRTAFKASLLLLIFDILCLLAFIIGLVLLLSTAMTFFQDTQFLWGIVCMMWQYLTPVFYPVSIIPEKFLPYYKLNPMYQFIDFARTCIIDGISPEPHSYFICLFSALATLMLGIFVFRKQQNKFVLYL